MFDSDEPTAFAHWKLAYLKCAHSAILDNVKAENNATLNEIFDLIENNEQLVPIEGF